MKGWESVSLEDLIRLERRPAKVLADHEYREIGIYCFGRGIFHKQPRSGLEVGDKKLCVLHEGDLILQITFAWEGAVALCGPDEGGLFGSTRYPTFRVDEGRCDARFLSKYLSTPAGREQLTRISPGSAGRNRVLNVKRLGEVEIPLPPLAEQRRIVALIEVLVAKIDEAKRLRKEAVEEAEAMCRAIIRTASNTTPTPMRELVDLRPSDVAVRADETYHFAGVYSFGRGVFRSVVKTGMEFAYPRLTRLRAGNFVYPKLMAWEGALGVVPEECDGLVVSTEFPVFEVRTDRVFPEVLEVYFTDASIWPELSGSSTGTNVRRRRLNPTDFLAYKLPLPDHSTQERLRDVRRQVTAANRLQAGTAAELDALLPAILHRAFKGEL